MDPMYFSTTIKLKTFYSSIRLNFFITDLESNLTVYYNYEIQVKQQQI